MATRRANDGNVYTMQEFQSFYGDAQGLNMWENAGAQEPGAATRRANDGNFYTMQEFQRFYGDAKGLNMWENAGAQEPGAAAGAQEPGVAAPGPGAPQAAATPSPATDAPENAGAQEPGAAVLSMNHEPLTSGLAATTHHAGSSVDRCATQMDSIGASPSSYHGFVEPPGGERGIPQGSDPCTVQVAYISARPRPLYWQMASVAGEKGAGQDQGGVSGNSCHDA